MYIKIRFYLILHILIILPAFVKSQSDSILHQKYSYYKARLQSQFMVRDMSDPYTAGTCIPASKRNSVNKKVEFGDATIFLANYIQVLATEYAWREREKMAVDTTLFELYQAIEAFVRVDRNAEYAFRSSGSLPVNSDINGFFIRDDIDSNFIANHAKQLFGVDSSWKVSSDFISHQRFNSKLDSSSQYGMEMSKDQCWHLYLAFSLVSKLVDHVELVDSSGNSYPFAKRVKEITKKIQFQLSGAGNPQHEWELFNPADGHEVPENRGGKVRLYSYGFGIAASEIVGKNQHAWHSRSDWWRSMFLSAWKWEDWEADDFGARALSTVGDVRGINDFLKLVDESKRKRIYSYPQFPLIHLLLYPNHYNGHDWQIAGSMADSMYHYLNLAPCDGTDYRSPRYWTSCNNMVWPERRGKAKTGDEFNGLDFMLMHNLYYLVKHELNVKTNHRLTYRQIPLPVLYKTLIASPFSVNYIAFN